MNENWVVWSLDPYGSEANRMVALHRPTGNLTGAIFSEGDLASCAQLRNDVAYVSVLSPLTQMDFPRDQDWLNETPMRGRVEVWNMATGATETLDLVPEGSWSPQSSEGDWMLLRHTPGWSRYYNSSLDGSMWLLDLRNGSHTSLDILVPGAPEKDGQASNDAYIANGTLFVEQHQSGGDSTVQAIDLMTNQTAWLQCDHNVTYFVWTNSGCFDTDWKTVHVLAAGILHNLSTPGREIASFSANDETVLWMEWDSSQDSLVNDLWAYPLPAGPSVRLGSGEFMSYGWAWFGDQLVVTEVHPGTSDVPIVVVYQADISDLIRV